MCYRKKEGVLMEKLFNIEDSLRQRLADIKTQHTGKIYHYTSAVGLKGIVDSGKIWFSDIGFLNDSSEATYIYKIIKPLLNKDNLSSDFKNLVYKLCSDFSKTDFCVYKNTPIWKNKCYVASFSTEKDCLSLWNYYTKNDNGVGYNIETDVYETFEHNPEIILINGKVIYNIEDQEKLLVNVLNNYNNYYNQNINNDINNFDEKIVISLSGILEFYNLFFKPKEYEVENEYRFVIFDKDCEIIRDCKYRINNGCYIPYYEMPLQNDAISLIYVSPAKEQEMLIHGVELLIGHTRFASANVKGSEIPKRY